MSPGTGTACSLCREASGLEISESVAKKVERSGRRRRWVVEGVVLGSVVLCSTVFFFVRIEREREREGGRERFGMNVPS